MGSASSVYRDKRDGGTKMDTLAQDPDPPLTGMVTSPEPKTSVASTMRIAINMALIAPELVVFQHSSSGEVLVCVKDNLSLIDELNKKSTVWFRVELSSQQEQYLNGLQSSYITFPSSSNSSIPSQQQIPTMPRREHEELSVRSLSNDSQEQVEKPIPTLINFDPCSIQSANDFHDDRNENETIDSAPTSCQFCDERMANKIELGAHEANCPKRFDISSKFESINCSLRPVSYFLWCYRTY